MEGLRSTIGMQKKDPTMMDELEKQCDCCPKMSRETRVYGFFACFFIGMALSFVGWLTLLSQNYESFAVLYTFGNVVALCSSGFLVGPCKQVKNMTKSHRIGCVIVYIVAMILTLVVAFKSGKPALCILCIFVQWCAAFWYFLSFIPYGRKMATNCCKTAVGV